MRQREQMSTNGDEKKEEEEKNRFMLSLMTSEGHL